MNFKITSIFLQKGHWDFYEGCIDSLDLINIAILTILNLPTQEHRISFYLLRSYLISLNVVL